MKVGPYHYISHFQQLPPSRNHPEIQERPLRLQEDVQEGINLIVDIPSVAAVSAFDKPLDSVTEEENYNDKKELSSTEDSVEKIMSKTSRTVYSMEFSTIEMAVIRCRNCLNIGKLCVPTDLHYSIQNNFKIVPKNQPRVS